MHLKARRVGQEASEVVGSTRSSWKVYLAITGHSRTQGKFPGCFSPLDASGLPAAAGEARAGGVGGQAGVQGHRLLHGGGLHDGAPGAWGGQGSGVRGQGSGVRGGSPSVSLASPGTANPSWLSQTCRFL